MEHGLRRVQGTCAVVNVNEEGRVIYFRYVSDSREFVSIGECEHGETAGGAVEDEVQ